MSGSILFICTLARKSRLTAATSPLIYGIELCLLAITTLEDVPLDIGLLLKKLQHGLVDGISIADSVCAALLVLFRGLQIQVPFQILDFICRVDPTAFLVIQIPSL